MIRLANEFGEVAVDLVRTRNGARLRISVPASGRQILLCPLELEALTLAGSRLLLPPASNPPRPGRQPLMGWLDGKRALVVGAGSGIGRTAW